MNTQCTTLSATLMAGLLLATTIAQANTITLAFESYLPSVIDSVATDAAFLGKTAIETTTGTYRLPADTTVLGTIEINLAPAPPDGSASPAYGIYESLSDFITVNYETLVLPNPAPLSALVHNDTARFETERGGSSSRDLFFYYDGISANWTDTTSGLRYALTLNSTLWVNSNLDDVLQSDALNQPVSWTSDATVVGEQTDFSLFYRLDTYDGPDLLGRDEARITTVDISQISAVPLPSAIWLLGSGIMGIAGIARRNQQAT